MIKEAELELGDIFYNYYIIVYIKREGRTSRVNRGYKKRKISQENNIYIPYASNNKEMG